jgi:glucan 1,3-beta-glucosidase
LDRENDKRKHRAEKERRRKRHRGEYQEVDTTPRSTPQKPRKHQQSKKRRVVSGAVMEEGRVGRSGLRGGGSWGEYEYEKEQLYRQHKKRKSRKKLCEQTL